MVSFIKKHQNKLIAAMAVIVILTGAWAVGGSINKPMPSYTRVTPPPIESADANISTVNSSPKVSPEASIIPRTDESSTPSPEPSAKPSSEPRESPEPSENPSPSSSLTPSSEPTQEINPDTVTDKYNTDPVPVGKPLPVEPENATLTSTAYTCTLSVRCDTILDNINNLSSEKVELVPEDGIIFAATTVTFYEGESVFNVLQREMRRASIHMEFVNTPIYNSAYIEGINNLYEFDCGELSGWMYKVNDWFPNYGCSRYQLKQGDVIEWIYTCDLGRDIGGFNAVGW